jgi:hypothetical protein
MKIFITFLLLISFASFSSATENPKTKSTDTASEYYILKGTSILFFEFMQILGPDGEELTEGATDIMSDYYWYANKAAEIFKNNNLAVDIIHNDKVRYNNKILVFDSYSNGGKCGVIIYNGKDKPKISYGISSTGDYIKEVEEYLKIKIKQ